MHGQGEGALGRADSRRRERAAKHDELRYKRKSVRALRRRQSRAIDKWQGKGWEFVSQKDRRFRTEMTFRRARPNRRWHRRIARLGLATCLVAGLVVASSQLPSVKDPLAEVRADAQAAIQALDAGDLAALDLQLAANRCQADFAYFSPHWRPRHVPWGCSGNGRGREQGSTAQGSVEAHAYDLALTDLAGTLGLATFGTGDRALPAEWTDDFITATTTPEALHYDEVNSPGDSADLRDDQDVANKQNLLLLLSRGYWSTGFLSKPSPTPTGSTTTTRATTRGPAQHPRMRSTPPLPPVST